MMSVEFMGMTQKLRLTIEETIFLKAEESKSSVRSKMKVMLLFYYCGIVHHEYPKGRTGNGQDYL